MPDPYDELAYADLANEPGMVPPREPLRIRVSPYDTPPPSETGWGGFGAGGRPAGRLFEPDMEPAPAPTGPGSAEGGPQPPWEGGRLFEPDQSSAPPPKPQFQPGLLSLGNVARGIGSLVQGARDSLNAPPAASAASATPVPARDPTAGPRQMFQQGYPSAPYSSMFKGPGEAAGHVATEVLQEPYKMVRAGQDIASPGATDQQVQQAREDEAGAATNLATNLYGLNAPFAAARPASAGVFGGRLAKGFDPNKEKLAATMEANGVPAPQIWKETGMVKFADGKWAHEISDLGAYYKGDVDSIAKSIFDQKYPDRAGTYGQGVQPGNMARSDIARNEALLKMQGKQQLYLPDVLHHPELFEKYPELRKMKVSEDAFMEAQGGYLPHSVIGTDVRPAKIKYREQYQPGKMARGATFDTLLHEIQHAIQQIEGMARGGNPARELALTPGTPANAIYQDMIKQIPPGLSASRIVQLKDAFAQQAGYQAYQRSAGEELANAIMQRRDMTLAQLAGVYPPSQFRTPMNEQIVEFNRIANPQGTTPQQMGGVLNPTPREMQMSGPSGLMPPKSERRAQGSLNPLDEADVAWKGKPMAEWKPQDWKEVGDHYGVKNLGPLSPVEKYVSPDGYHFEIPGGTKGTWTYYDLLHMKANPINPNNLPHELHAELQRKLGRTMTPHGEVGQDQIWNGFMFGMTSATNPLFPNQLSASRLRLRDPKMLDALADSIPWKAGDTVSKELRGEKDLEIGRMFNLHEGKSAGSTGLGTRGGVNYTYIAELAQMFRKNPEWFRKKADEPWVDFVERLATQTKGLSMKTGSFSSVWQDPYHAAISAIDRHMAKEFERRGGLFLNPADQDKWQAKTLAKWNKDKELTGDQRIGSWNELTQQRGFEGFMSEELLSYVGAHSKKDFRNTAGEINPSLPKHVREAKTFYEPEKGLEAGAAYKRALAVNQKAANEQGLNLFMSQWFEWDRIRQRFEPHENMFPGLSRMPAPSARQLDIPFKAHAETGHTNYDYGPTNRMNPTKKFPRNPSEMGYLGVPLAAGGAAGIGSLVDPSKYQPEAR